MRAKRWLIIISQRQNSTEVHFQILSLFFSFCFVSNSTQHRFDFRVSLRSHPERIPIPEVFPENELSNNIVMLSEQTDWVPTAIVGIAIVTASLIV